jgi:GntR family transcriptional regulator
MTQPSARICPLDRAALGSPISQGATPDSIAAAYGVTTRTVSDALAAAKISALCAPRPRPAPRPAPAAPSATPAASPPTRTPPAAGHVPQAAKPRDSAVQSLEPAQPGPQPGAARSLAAPPIRRARPARPRGAAPEAITVATPASPADRLLPTAEVAAILRVDPRTVARWAQDGKLASVRTPGGHRRYSQCQVRSLLAGWQPGPIPPGPPAVSPSPDRRQMTDAPPAAYARIADDLAARITSGEFPAGRLPGERPLAREYGVAYLTLRRATALLRERGMIATRQGQASHILTPPGPGH